MVCRADVLGIVTVAAAAGNVYCDRNNSATVTVTATVTVYSSVASLAGSFACVLSAIRRVGPRSANSARSRVRQRTQRLRQDTTNAIV